MFLKKIVYFLFGAVDYYLKGCIVEQKYKINISGCNIASQTPLLPKK